LTALVSGVATGATVSGALADGPGRCASVLVAAAAAAVGAVIALARRASLVPAGEGPSPEVVCG
jgi:hypothetical protein